MKKSKFLCYTYFKPSKFVVCSKCGKVIFKKNIIESIYKLLIVSTIVVLLWLILIFNNYFFSFKQDDINNLSAFYVGDMFENRYYKMLYVSSNNAYKHIDKNNRIVEITLYIKNISQKSQKISTSNFECYSHDVLYPKGDAEVIHKLSTGKSIHINIRCIIPNNENQIKIEYKPGIYSKTYDFIVY